MDKSDPSSISSPSAPQPRSELHSVLVESQPSEVLDVEQPVSISSHVPVLYQTQSISEDEYNARYLNNVSINHTYQDFVKVRACLVKYGTRDGKFVKANTGLAKAGSIMSQNVKNRFACFTQSRGSPIQYSLIQ